MNRNLLSLFWLLTSFYAVSAQGPVVPERMQFADIKLKITEGARKEIQTDVDDLTQSTRYFEAKVERARMYFPVIERILSEENVPDDIKYLVIQESALIPDAVSVSDAVGFWQFKDFTAAEMGLRVDNHVDERMNIVSSTRAAAKYFKKNNFYFDNWLFALQSYQMGAGGVLKKENNKYFGAKSMTITKGTYWYIKKYLAHRIAFEDALQKHHPSKILLKEYIVSNSKTLSAISREFNVDKEELERYNMWLKKGRIPDDKDYTVIIPYDRDVPAYFTLDAQVAEKENRAMLTSAPRYKGAENPEAFPVIARAKRFFSKKPEFIMVNGIPGVIGNEGMIVIKVADSAGITETQFRKYNDIYPHETITVGQVYYFKSKKGKAKVHYHTVMPGESLWEISQKYGVRMAKLLKKNKLADASEIKQGLVLWLRYIRPANEPVAYRQVAEDTGEKEIVKNERLLKGKNEKISINHSSDFSVKNLSGPGKIEVIPKEKSTFKNAEIDSVETKTIYHIVRPKETLYSISRLYNVPVLKIAGTNDIKIGEVIRSGQSLVINVPVDYKKENVGRKDVDKKAANGNAVVSEFDLYVVKPGDTLYSIARKHGVTVQKIQEWNAKTDSGLEIGEKLKISKRRD